MSRTTRSLICSLSVVVALILVGLPAHADTYSVTAVRSTQSETFTAGDDYGDYTINVSDLANSLCGTGPGSSCYLTYYHSTGQTVYTSLPPMLPIDPSPIAGPGCAPGMAGVILELCNNGHPIYFATALSGLKRGIYDGLSAADFLYGGSFDGGLMSPNGNFFYIDGVDDTLNVGLDLTTLAAAPVPEPSSVVLVTIGVLSWVEAIRRRRAV